MLGNADRSNAFFDANRDYLHECHRTRSMGAWAPDRLSSGDDDLKECTAPTTDVRACSIYESWCF